MKSLFDVWCSSKVYGQNMIVFIFNLHRPIIKPFRLRLIMSFGMNFDFFAEPKREFCTFVKNFDL